jgi:hypothetical protein
LDGAFRHLARDRFQMSCHCRFLACSGEPRDVRGVRELALPEEGDRAAACPQRSNRQRVAPYGSAVATPKAVWKMKR